MKDDYLWDKSGEPSEEVERLEGLLSAYRHKPEPLVLPQVLPESGGGSGLPKWLGIAAAALLVVGFGIWMGLRQKPVNIAKGSVPVESKAPAVDLPRIPPPVTKVEKNEPPEDAEFARNDEANYSAQRRAAERRGRIAREKVLFALQVTSSKIQMIDRKLESDLN